MNKYNMMISELVLVTVPFDYLIKAMILLSGRLHTYIVLQVQSVYVSLNVGNIAFSPSIGQALFQALGKHQ